jgi:CRP/FNR family transcriptional regulator, cyclic AMP receptor protein
VDAAEILALTADHPEMALADGAPLLVEGVRGDSLYVLVSGALEVRRRERTVTVITEPGSVVGEMGLLLQSPASADVLASGNTTVRRIDDAEAFFERYPSFSRYVATLLAQRLLQISTYLADLQEQFADRTDILGLVPTVIENLLGSDRAAPDVGSEREPDAPY